MRRSPLIRRRRVTIHFLSRRLENAAAFHRTWRGDPELSEYRRGDIRQSGVFRVDLVIAQDHTRNFREIYTVVAAPGLGVVFHHLRSNAAHHAFPAAPLPPP